MMKLDIPPGDFRAFIFDCDGTLADTMPLHYQAWLAALTPLGCDFPEDVFYSLGGTPTAGVVDFLNARNGLNLPSMEVAKHKEKLFLELIPQVRPIEPVVAFMKEVSARGFPVAVGSGGFKAVVLAILEALGLRGYFQAVVTAEDVAHGKPAPDTYLEAARLLGVAPADCLVFEDTPLGCECAVNAGMLYVLVASGPVVPSPK
jgi:HAD superfamily hydrolase (TIGR01509 family)